MHANYIDEGSCDKNVMSLGEREKIRYRFPDVVAADAFWYHLVLLLSARQGYVSRYSYCPHYWFFVTHNFVTHKYLETNVFYNSSSYELVGGRSDINLWSETLIPKNDKVYYNLTKPLNKNPEIYLTSVGEFLVTFKLKKDFAKDVEKLCKETKFDIKKERPPEGLVEFFRQKSSTTVIVERNKVKAQRFARKIGRYF